MAKKKKKRTKPPESAPPVVRHGGNGGSFAVTEYRQPKIKPGTTIAIQAEATAKAAAMKPKPVAGFDEPKAENGFVGAPGHAGGLQSEPPEDQ